MDYPIKLHTEVVIDGAHYLRNYNGACQNLPGHSWSIRGWIRGYSSQLDDLGILFDFSNVKLLKDLYDHKCLNEIPPFNGNLDMYCNPTAENIALTIYDKLKDLAGSLEFVVRVYENSIGKECWAQTGDWDENS